MLTASLQSTWESQRNKQKPRPYQNFTSNDENVKTLFPNHVVSNSTNNRTDNASSELPNLRAPQVYFTTCRHV